MVENAVSRDEQREIDERRLGRTVARGLPLVTIAAAAITGVVVGPATSVLVVAAGLLLGVIALAWTSLRILSGDVSLPPELAALDGAARGVDALAGRKNMLLRALKDLENEHAVGKMDDDDYEPMALAYRDELKTLLKRIDETLAPHRAKAEEFAREHFRKVGLDDVAPAPADAVKESASPAPPLEKGDPSRIPCPKCGDSNEAGAKFCKECATKLSPSTSAQAPEDTTTSPDEA